MLTINNDDDRNRQHILGIGNIISFCISAEEDRICVPIARSQALQKRARSTHA